MGDGSGAVRIFEQALRCSLPLYCPGRYAIRLREGPNGQWIPHALVESPNEDQLHVFGGNQVRAMGHAVEEVAFHSGRGELIALFPDLEAFLPLRERYGQLARKPCRIRVWAPGTPPKRCPKIDFVVSVHPRLAKYRLYLFSGEDRSALVCCKQLSRVRCSSNGNREALACQERYIGFCSFDPYVVESVRWRFNLLSCGLEKLVRRWEGFFPLPTPPLRAINDFVKSHATLERSEFGGLS
ncbi:conserved protein of unknown function [Methylacidimicrobium sp. AP8]|uniref:hypothetical protein n=1 Tax=Methylacidimicrobium sp. AP8 TaxID=2730359 RepID=UPI0018C13600|nr:hypothetical protein [Methylacidimicrobium sp. AP8]CAB4242465.1 conserved protein of unknown function [Methylacidimicrobium sp. AP8]